MLNGFFTQHTWVEIKVSITREFFLKIWFKQCFQVPSTCCQGSFPHCCTVDIVYFLPASHWNVSLSLPIFPMEGWELPKLTQVSQVPWGWYTYIILFVWANVYACITLCAPHTCRNLWLPGDGIRPPGLELQKVGRHLMYVLGSYPQCSKRTVSLLNH